MSLKTILALTIPLAMSSTCQSAFAQPPTGASASPTISAATMAGGIRPDVDPSTDLGAHVVGPEPTWNDSIYIAGRVVSGTHHFGILAHALTMPNQKITFTLLAITDETDGSYKQYLTLLPPGGLNWTPTALSIKTPGQSWSGNPQSISVTSTAPWGKLDVHLSTRGPDLNYNSIGIVPLFGAVDHEFAFPSMATTGTLTLAGKTYPITGMTWFDRQWGPLYDLRHGRWTWMDLSMPNGDKVAIWDTVLGSAENAWATVLHPDGSYSMAAVTPLAGGATETYTDPMTHMSYPTKWRVAIPSMKAALMVSVTGTKSQSIPMPPHYEGTAAFTGTYEGKKVSGLTFAEMTGNWQKITDAAANP